MFISAYELFFEYYFAPIGFYFPGKDDAEGVDGQICMSEVVSPEHLKKKIAANSPYFSQMFYLSRMLLSMRIDS